MYMYILVCFGINEVINLVDTYIPTPSLLGIISLMSRSPGDSKKKEVDKNNNNVTILVSKL